MRKWYTVKGLTVASYRLRFEEKNRIFPEITLYLDMPSKK
jgi:hypothetical protein